MRSHALAACACAAALAAGCGPAGAGPEAGPAAGARRRSPVIAPMGGSGITKIAECVWVVLRKEPLGLANHSNNVIIVTDEHVVVVDTPFTRSEAALVINAIRRITDRPVKYVINTHWHDDHTFGNQVFADSFPGVEFVAHEKTGDDMATIGVENRRRQVEGGPGAVDMFIDAAEGGRSLDGSPISPDERDAYLSTAVLAEAYLEEAPGFRLTLPTITFRDRLTLPGGCRTIDIIHVGPGVTRGDAVVHLPEDGILIAGDVVDSPVPFAYGADVEGWIAALARLRAMRPRLIVPGHGPVLTGGAQIDLLERTLKSLAKQARAARARGETAPQARSSVNLEEFRAQLTGGGKFNDFLFRHYFAGPAVDGIVEEQVPEGLPETRD